MAHDRLSGDHGVEAGRHAHAHGGPGAGYDGVRRALDGRRVDADHRDGGAAEELLGDVARAGERDTGEHAGVAPKRRLVVACAFPGHSLEPFHRDVAGRVVQRGQHADQRGQGIGSGAAVLAAVDRAGQGADLD